ncbi:MAG TPA: hypothetical protein VMV53_05655 [Acidimicrobiales bacterium]|nr:hypothetical protein [Acidimicrobiales bacterium]
MAFLFRARPFTRLPRLGRPQSIVADAEGGPTLGRPWRHTVRVALVVPWHYEVCQRVSRVIVQLGCAG